jgi:ABC-type transport system involved in multi-copper enzyme maturation permease subunit
MIIWAIAKATVGEALRKKILNVFVIVTIFLIVISFSFSSFGFGQDITIIKSFGLGMIAIAGLFISLILCVSLLPNEIERRTIYTILSKPVMRYEFIVGKYLGAVITLAFNVGLMGAAFIATVAVKAHFGVITTVPTGPLGAVTVGKPGIFDGSLALGVLMLYFQFVLLCSVAMMFSVIATPTVNFFLTSMVYILGLIAPATKALATGEEKLSIGASQAPSVAPLAIRLFYKCVNTIIPKFDYFNQQNPIIHPEQTITNMNLWVAECIGYAILFSVVLLTIAVIAFERREV